MLTSKQRAYLKSIANSLDPVFQIGKGGISEEQAARIDDYLRVHEIMKVKVLENSLLTAKEAIGALAEAISAEPVAAIGSIMILYKRNNKDPKITLPR